MAGDGNDWIVIARRVIALAVLLLSAPLVASADPALPAKDEAAKPEVAVDTCDKPAPVDSATKALNLTVPAIESSSLPAPPGALPEDGNEPPAAARIPEVVVEASVASKPAITHSACGFASIAELLAHPTGAWREFAPLSDTDTDTGACVKATAIGTDLPEAFGSMHWYE